MADITREIEITAALSSDYQASFKAASSIARDTASELAKLSKRESDLARMTEIAGKSAQASAAGDAKAVASLQKEYEKLADKLGLADRSAEGLAAELARVGAQRRQIEALNRSASRSAEIGRLARRIQEYTAASRQVRDPAIQAALERVQRRFRELGGVIPRQRETRETSGFFSALRDGAMRAPGPLGDLFRSASSVGGGLTKFTGGAMVAVGAIAAVTAAVVGATKAMWEFGKQTIDEADKIAKTSRQLGIASDAYQELAYAVGMGGASEQDFSSALQQLNKQMEAAAGGNKKAMTAFKDLGISMREVKSMNAEEMFVRISDALSGVDDVASKTRTTMALFGSGGTKVATAIADGSEALEKFRKEAREAGYVLDSDALANAEEAGDNFARAQLQLQGVIRQLGVEAMPVMNEALTEFITLLRDNKDDIKEFASFMGDVFTGSIRLLVNSVKALRVVFKSFVNGIEYWQEQFAAFLTNTDRGISATVDFIKNIPTALSTAVGALVGKISGMLESARNMVSEWISSVADYAVDFILDKVRSLASALSDTPIIGGLLEKVFPSGAGPTTIVVNTSVDARGAAPGAGADVDRAVTAAAGASGEAVADAIAGYTRLSYGGAA